MHLDNAERVPHDFCVEKGIVGAAAVGELTYKHDAQTIFLASIEILPEYQKKGLGTTILRALLDEAKDSHKEIMLQVLKANPDAQWLYERLDFLAYGETKCTI